MGWIDADNLRKVFQCGPRRVYYTIYAPGHHPTPSELRERAFQRGPQKRHFFSKIVGFALISVPNFADWLWCMIILSRLQYAATPRENSAQNFEWYHFSSNQIKYSIASHQNQFWYSSVTVVRLVAKPCQTVGNQVINHINIWWSQFWFPIVVGYCFGKTLLFFRSAPRWQYVAPPPKTSPSTILDTILIGNV